MTMKLMPMSAALFGVTALFAMAGVGGSLEAQDVRTECRCVDADGRDLDGCTCIRTPSMESLLERYGVERQRARLGVSVDQGQAARFDADGARLSDVLRGGPADDAGLREGDVIVRLDGQPLTESVGADLERSFDLDGSAPVQRLLVLARALDPGQAVEVEYLRDGQLQSTVIEAEELSDSWGGQAGIAMPTWDAERFQSQLRGLTEGARGRSFRFEGPERDVRVRLQGPGSDHVTVLGGGAGFFFGDGLHSSLELVELNPGLGAYFGTDEGVLVVDVEAESELGLRAGDVVLSIGDRGVVSPDHLHRILSSYQADEEIRFRVQREGEQVTVTGRRGERMP